MPEEIDLSADVEHWNTFLSLEDQTTVAWILSFLNMTEFIPKENLIARMLDEVASPEAKCFFRLQMVTWVHRNALSILPDVKI